MKGHRQSHVTRHGTARTRIPQVGVTFAASRCVGAGGGGLRFVMGISGCALLLQPVPALRLAGHAMMGAIAATHSDARIGVAQADPRHREDDHGGEQQELAQRRKHGRRIAASLSIARGSGSQGVTVARMSSLCTVALIDSHSSRSTFQLSSCSALHKPTTHESREPPRGSPRRNPNIKFCQSSAMGGSVFRSA